MLRVNGKLFVNGTVVVDELELVTERQACAFTVQMSPATNVLVAMPDAEFHADDGTVYPMLISNVNLDIGGTMQVTGFLNPPKRK